MSDESALQPVAVEPSRARLATLELQLADRERALAAMTAGLAPMLFQLSPALELGCETALALAARSGRAPGEIGKLCDDNGIRICACQLGCFPCEAPRGSLG